MPDELGLPKSVFVYLSYIPTHLHWFFVRLFPSFFPSQYFGHIDFFDTQPAESLLECRSVTLPFPRGF